MIGRPHQLGDSIGDYRLDPPPDDADHTDSSDLDDRDFAEWVERDLELLTEQWPESATFGAVGADHV